MQHNIVSQEYVVGVDLGQKRDFTAVAVLDRTRVLTGRISAVTRERETEEFCQVRMLERLPLGTSYNEITARVLALGKSLHLKGKCSVVLDETGVGAPVFDMLRYEAPPFELAGITITAGGMPSTTSYQRYRVPKMTLITGLQVLFETDRLKIASGLREGATLVKELASFESKISLSGNEQAESWRSGTHDDLVLATALGCWWAIGRHHGQLRMKQAKTNSYEWITL